METHVRVLAWIYIIFGALGVLGGLFLLVFFGGIGAIVGEVGDRDAEIAAPVMKWLGAILFGVVAVMSLPSIAAGWGLLERAEWGRILTMILSAINLLGFPFGTILGIYGLWVLLNKETAPLFGKT